MPRIRTLKPAFWADDAVASLTIEARLLTIGLISFADDEGRFLASVTAIGGYLFPHDDVPVAKMRRWLDEVEHAGIVRLYHVNRHQYGVFPNWSRHQRINRPAASVLPCPPAIQ